MAPRTAAGTSVARGYLPKIARAASHTPLMVSASPMGPRILAQPSAHGKRADLHLPATVVRFVHAFHDVLVSPAHHLLRGPGLPFHFWVRTRLAGRYPEGSRMSLRTAPPGQSAPPVASMSRATAAVQDCSLEPSASPVNGSKYSAKPPSESSSRVSRRIP